MSTSFKGYACWTESDALAVLTTEALAGSDVTFLATHLPITDFDVRGDHGTEVATKTERGLLDVLSKNSRPHAFCLVEGEPGSGKSHLIRWLGAKWERSSRDLVLLIQRADGSLEGTLDQLSRKIPEKYRHLFAGIGRRHEMTLEGRARAFLAILAIAVRSDSFSTEQPHSAWCEQNQIDTLLNSQVLQDNWTAPGRILKILSGRDGERLSEVASFGLRDVTEIARLEHQLNKVVGFKTIRLMRTLKTESEKICSFLDQGLTEDTIREQYSTELRESVTLVEALNSRLNHAIQNLLGISAQGLRELFMTLRRELRRDGQRLILLLEDITNFQGVDNQLIDVLVTDSTTRGDDQDLCDMVSVVGITPAYRHSSLQANYLARVTHWILLGNQHGGSHYQDVANLRTEEAQVRFAANYLRAARAGVQRLEHWGGSEREAVPNICDGCFRRPACHSAFGVVDGVGLFPFTASAISGMFARLEDPHGGMTHRTPRGLIQGILNPTMLHPHSIVDGQFPSSLLDISWLPENSRRLSGKAHQILSAQVPDDQTRQRMVRLISLWSRNGAMDTRQSQDGTFQFAGINQGVFEAFGLPWIGDDANVSTEETTSDLVTPTLVESPEILSIKPIVRAIDRTDRAIKEAVTQAKNNKETPTKNRVKLRPAEVQTKLDQVRAWRDGKRLEHSDFWNALVKEIVFSFSADSLEIPAFILSKFFTENLVKIEGTGQVNATHFVVPAQAWLREGLESYFLLKTKSSEDVEYDRRRAARMVTELRDCVFKRSQVVVPSANEQPWSVVSSLVQLIAAADWLSGRVSPLAPLSVQWRHVVGAEESSISSDASDRTVAWNRCSIALRNMRTKFVEILKWWVTIVAAKDKPYFTAPAECYSALKRLRDRFELDEVPITVASQEQWNEMAKVAAKANEIAKDFSKLTVFEVRRIHEEVQLIDQLLRQCSLAEHTSRIDAVCDSVARCLPLTSERLRDWSTKVGKLRSDGCLSGGTTVDLVAFIDDALDKSEEIENLKPVDRFSWAQRAPVEHLRAVSETLKAGENVIMNLMMEVQLSADIKSGENSAATLVKVHDFGEQMQSVANRLQNGLRKDGK